MTDALRTGYIYGFIAYGLWGLIPIYFRVLTTYTDSYEILGQRIVWSAVMLIVVLSVLRRWRELYEAVRRPRGCLALLASSALIGANWFVYIYGVQTQRVVYCSLGYFITPALVGGGSDNMIAGFIDTAMNSEGNWGKSSALGFVLLTATLVLYYIYNRLIGIDKMKLG